MVVYKQHIDEYLKCPFMFGKNIVSSKQNTIKLADMNLNIKKHLIEMASDEMQNGTKYSLQDYRIKYTNRYYSRPSQVLEAEAIVPKLNTVFESFASNQFRAYNLPIDIPVPGTPVIFRDIIDFLLVDEDGNLKIIEIVDLSNMDEVKKKLKWLPHYHIPYSFLADQFSKDIEVILFDPSELSTITNSYAPERYEDDLMALKSVTCSMASKFLVKNLNYCENCDIEECN